MQKMFHAQNNMNEPTGFFQGVPSHSRENAAADFAFMSVMEVPELTVRQRGSLEGKMSRKVKAFKEEILTEIGGDRRAGRRYDIDLDLQYKVVKRHQVSQSGCGKTVNLSGGGIAIQI